MAHARRSPAACAQTSTVDAFTGLVCELAAPVAAGRGVALEQAAEIVEAIDQEVREQVLLVAPPRSSAGRRRPR